MVSKNKSKILFVLFISFLMCFLFSCENALLVRSTLSRQVSGGGGGSSSALAWDAYEFVDIRGAVINVAPGGTTGDSIKNTSYGKYFSNVTSSPITVNDFSIGKYEVNYRQWKEVVDDAASKGYEFAYNGPSSNHTDANPVFYISARDAIVWCNLASEIDGLEPVYFDRINGQVIKKSEKGNVSRSGVTEGDSTVTAVAGGGAAENAVIKDGANGYRLPTLEEWVLVAKGGDVTKEAWNQKYMAINDVSVQATNSIRELNEYGIVSFAEIKHTAVNGSTNINGNAGELKPISGLYHLLGNVAEYCFSTDDNYNRTLAVCGWSYNSDQQTSNVDTNPMGILFVNPGDPLPNGAVYTGFRVVRNK